MLKRIVWDLPRVEAILAQQHCLLAVFSTGQNYYRGLLVSVRVGLLTMHVPALDCAFWLPCRAHIACPQAVVLYICRSNCVSNTHICRIIKVESSRITRIHILYFLHLKRLYNIKIPVTNHINIQLLYDHKTRRLTFDFFVVVVCSDTNFSEPERNKKKWQPVKAQRNKTVRSRSANVFLAS